LAPSTGLRESDLDTLTQKVMSVRREIRNLIVMGMDPKQPPD
jgi:hypothetical protein